METVDQLKLVEFCLSNIGEMSFLDGFLSIAREVNATQTTVISYNEEKPKYLLRHNFRVAPIADILVQIYLKGAYKHDPVYKKICSLPNNSVEVQIISNMLQTFPDIYRSSFENLLVEIVPEAGLISKIAILCVGEKEKMAVTFYFDGPIGENMNTPFWSIIGRLSLLHFEHVNQSGPAFPPVLMSLSEREREVCRGILSGKKAERIAADMDVAPSTVVTYRKRAYEKLGISSRTSLFEICGS
nr:helix-turn-helix transcriptional regulator [uncultured Cohaesibacter sp.]